MHLPAIWTCYRESVCRPTVCSMMDTLNANHPTKWTQVFVLLKQSRWPRTKYISRIFSCAADNSTPLAFFYWYMNIHLYKVYRLNYLVTVLGRSATPRRLYQRCRTHCSELTRSNMSAILPCPKLLASEAGVLPSLSTKSTFAPAAISNFTIAS